MYCPVDSWLTISRTNTKCVTVIVNMRHFNYHAHPHPRMRVIVIINTMFTTYNTLKTQYSIFLVVL